MKGSKLCLSLLTLFIISGCTTKDKSNNDFGDKLEYTVLEENFVNPSIRGIWKSIGNGYYLEARGDSILLYSYTESYCYKEKNDYLEGLLNSQSQFLLRGDTLSIYLTDYGTETRHIQSKKDFKQVDQLPKHCITFTELTKLNSQNQLQLYKETLKENYAFNQRRNLNWNKIFEPYYNAPFLEKDELLNTMGQIATLTKDQHTKVISKDGKKLQYQITPSALDVQKAFENQSEVKTLNEYFNLFFNTSYKNISDSLLMGRGKKVANGNIEWGELSEEVGYISIFSFAGFLSKDFTRKDQVDSIKMYMDRILSTLQDKEAIIVDISFNFGGFDASGLTIAGYFTDQPIQAYTLQVYNNGDFYDEDEVIIRPTSSIAYKKPVYVLMTDISRSAAESFAMMMNALPNVKLVGTSTLGTLSGMLGKSIADFYTTYSNQRLVDSAGNYYEVSGLKPDIEINVFHPNDVINGHKNAVEEVLKIIDKQEIK